MRRFLLVTVAFGLGIAVGACAGVMAGAYVGSTFFARPGDARGDVVSTSPDGQWELLRWSDGQWGDQTGHLVLATVGERPVACSSIYDSHGSVLVVRPQILEGGDGSDGDVRWAPLRPE